MNILNVTSAVSPMGGTITKIRKLVQSSRHQNIIYFYLRKETYDRAQNEKQYYIHHNIKAYYGNYGNNFFKHAKAISKIIKQEKIDIVNFYFHAETPCSIILRRIHPKVKLIRTFEGYVSKKGYRNFILKLGLKRIDHLIYISDYIKKCYEKDFDFLKKKKNSIIYNSPIKIHEPQITQSERHLVSYVGGLNVNKNVPLLIDMMNVVVNLHKRQDIVLSIIGDGADRNEIENKIKGFNLENNVNLLGNQSDVSRFLDDTKVYVHSATNEGFGISVVEAMYMKCPCILADASALPELIDESCGYLISPERPDIWAEKLIFLVDNPLVRLKMGEAAHKRVQEKFSFDSYVNNIDKLYDELIENAHHQ